VKQFKLVYSLNKVSEIRKIKALNWYAHKLSTALGFDKDWKREHIINTIIITIKTYATKTLGNKNL
jgi:hypothetical protein